MIPHSRKVPDPRRELDRLEVALQALKVEFDKFFNSASPIPPEKSRTLIFKRFQKLRTLRLRTFADRFRLNTLETRLNVLNELWNRRLRELEHASRRRSTTSASASAAPDPLTGISLDGTTDRQRVEALYNELYSSSGRTNKTDFDSFRDYLERTILQLREKTGCQQVQFRVTGEGSKLKLKAKPMRATARPRGVQQ